MQGLFLYREPFDLKLEVRFLINSSLLVFLHLLDPILVKSDLISHASLIVAHFIDSAEMEFNVSLKVSASTFVQICFLSEVVVVQL